MTSYLTDCVGFFTILSSTYISYLGLSCCCCWLWCLLWFWSRKWRYFSLCLNCIDNTLWIEINKGCINKFTRPIRGWIASKVDPHRESNTLMIACIDISKYQSSSFTCGVHLIRYISYYSKYPPIISLYAYNVALKHL